MKKLSNTDLIGYCANCMHDEVLQKDVESKALMLIEGVLSEKDDYQKEKAIKVFSEGLRYLENSLLYKRGIHPNQYDFTNITFMNEYGEKFTEVRKIMTAEISRQFRHFTIMF